ncbi:hypothetical protein TRV_04295, partial [Trichophyton verrucosum HKI 0517]
SGFSFASLCCLGEKRNEEKKRSKQPAEEEETETETETETEATEDGVQSIRIMEKQLQQPSMPAHLSESALWPELFLAGPLIESVQSIKSSQSQSEPAWREEEKLSVTSSRSSLLSRRKMHIRVHILCSGLYFTLSLSIRRNRWRESGLEKKKKQDYRQHKKINAKREANGRTCAPFTCLRLCLASLHLYLTGGFGLEQRGQRLGQTGLVSAARTGDGGSRGTSARCFCFVCFVLLSSSLDLAYYLFDNLISGRVVVSFGTALCLDPQREQELTREVARKQTARQLLEAGVDNYRWSSLSERALANSTRPLVLVPGEFTSRYFIYLTYIRKKYSYNTKYTELKIYKASPRERSIRSSSLSLALLHWIPGASAAPGWLVGFKREIELFREGYAVRNRQLVNSLQQELRYSYSTHTHL